MNTLPRHFPKLPAKLLAKIPNRYHSQILALGLNRLLTSLLATGELDFLENKTLKISLLDVNICFCLGIQQQRLTPSQAPPNLSIEGNVYDFLCLATQHEDPDSLFFQRRLRLTGDINLGLQLKNFLDRVEPELHFPKFQSLLMQSLPIYQRIIGG
jgi:predicted lipid carrier protein YhbT